jgi:hypothetical protein
MTIMKKIEVLGRCMHEVHEKFMHLYILQATFIRNNAVKIMAVPALASFKLDYQFYAIKK